MAGFFYIVKTVDVDDDVYKIGKTTQSDPNKRLCNYPKGSSVKYTIAVDNVDVFEDYIMRKFGKIFVRRIEYGLEYYQGDLTAMINTSHELWNHFNNQTGTEEKTDNKQDIPNEWDVFYIEWLSKQNTMFIEDDEAFEIYSKLVKNPSNYTCFVRYLTSQLS